jgi:hypothetical protein
MMKRVSLFSISRVVCMHAMNIVADKELVEKGSCNVFGDKNVNMNININNTSD